MGHGAGVQEARSMEYGSFPLASWLCRHAQPALALSCRAGCRRSLMIGALACRYLGTTPARLLGTLLAVALTGKGPQRAWHAGPGLPGFGAKHQAISVLLSVSTVPSRTEPYRTRCPTVFRAYGLYPSVPGSITTRGANGRSCCLCQRPTRSCWTASLQLALLLRRLLNKRAGKQPTH